MKKLIRLCVIPFAAVGLQSSPTSGQDQNLSQGENAGRPAGPWVEGLSQAEAGELVAKLAEAQRKLRNGEGVHFQLLAGTRVSNLATVTSPREAFLGVSLHNPHRVVRLPDTDPQLYRVFVIADTQGDRALWWNMEITLVFGEIERVEMLYEPTPPF